VSCQAVTRLKVVPVYQFEASTVNLCLVIFHKKQRDTFCTLGIIKINTACNEEFSWSVQQN